MRIERYSSAINELIRKKPNDSMNNIQKLFFNYLTPYSYKIVKNEISKLNLQLDFNCIDNGSCSCLTAKSFSLPCNHIFS